MKNIILFFLFAAVFFSVETLRASEEFIYNDNGNRDPMWPLVTANGIIKNYNKDFSIANISIEGILYEPDGKSVAIINGNIFKEKDALGPYVVSSIQKEAVILTRGDQKIELRITRE